MKKGLKDMLQPQGLFEDLGLKYVGPIDGHDIAAMEGALRRARDFGGPVIVHAVTRKGYGYAPAEDDEADCLHGPGAFDPDTGKVHSAGERKWTHLLAEELVSVGAERPDVVALTAAMLEPVGLRSFAAAFPDRVFDVGIAEQHAVTSAAGLAMGGLHPVVCVYATFLNRAFDQVLLDVALHRLPVTFVLDRAGVTGDDGASHNGMWDLAVFQAVPGIRVAAPRDGATLRAELREALAVADGPTVIRFPKATVTPDVPAVDRVGGVDVLRRSGDEDVLVISVGALAGECLGLAERVVAQGIGVTVVDPRWVVPVESALIPLAARHRLVVTVEDGLRDGGVGAATATALRDAGVPTPVRMFGLPREFLSHASRAEVLAEAGLTAQELLGEVDAELARLDHALEVHPAD